jgi:hypothetical protein
MAWEEWYIIEASIDGGGVILQSCAHGTYLHVDSDEKTSCTFSEKPHLEERYLFKFKKLSTGLSSYTIVNSQGNFLCCRENGELSLMNDAAMLSSDQKEWNIELLSGELCFISSPTLDKRLSCRWAGKLSLTSNWKGWEIWRFIEAGDGHVRICNWTHTNKFLCSDNNGNIWTSDNHIGDWELWDVERAPNNVGYEGVVIKSVCHGRFLVSSDEDGSTIRTSERFNKSAVWQTDAGNQNEFYLTSTLCDKRIGSSKDSVYSTKNRKSWEIWVLKKEHNGFISLRSKAHNRKLASYSDGSVYVTDIVNCESSLWKMETLGEKGLCLKSVKHNRFLSCSSRCGSIFTLENVQSPSILFVLEPCLPSQTTSEETMKKLAIGGSVAVASAVVAPFAVMGIVTGLGFTSGGIAAGSAGAAMMSAEALASGGMIAAGGTVATLQSIGAAGLGLAGTSAAMSAGAVVGAGITGAIVPFSSCSPSPSSHYGDKAIVRPVHRRPMCNWRNW